MTTTVDNLTQEELKELLAKAPQSGTRLSLKERAIVFMVSLLLLPQATGGVLTSCLSRTGLAIRTSRTTSSIRS